MFPADETWTRRDEIGAVTLPRSGAGRRLGRASRDLSPRSGDARSAASPLSVRAAVCRPVRRTSRTPCCASWKRAAIAEFRAVDGQRLLRAPAGASARKGSSPIRLRRQPRQARLAGARPSRRLAGEHAPRRTSRPRRSTRAASSSPWPMSGTSCAGATSARSRVCRLRPAARAPSRRPAGRCRAGRRRRRRRAHRAGAGQGGIAGRRAGGWAVAQPGGLPAGRARGDLLLPPEPRAEVHGRGDPLAHAARTSRRASRPSRSAG